MSNTRPENISRNICRSLDLFTRRKHRTFEEGDARYSDEVLRPVRNMARGWNCILTERCEKFESQKGKIAVLHRRNIELLFGQRDREIWSQEMRTLAGSAINWRASSICLQKRTQKKQSDPFTQMACLNGFELH